MAEGSMTEQADQAKYDGAVAARLRDMRGEMAVSRAQLEDLLRRWLAVAPNRRLLWDGTLVDDTEEALLKGLGRG